MLSPELIKKANQIFIRSRHKATDAFAGEFESAFRGRGIEFEEFREYVPGDDVRQIDWNVTARFDKPFIKIYREEREQTIFFLIDLSGSQNFGSKRTKKDIITEIAALLAYATIKSNDKVGLILFTDRVEKYIPPKKGRAHVWNLIATILNHEPQGKRTDISKAIQFFRDVAHRRVTCFLMSDYWDEGFLKALKVAQVKHDLVALRVLDPLEKNIPHGALIGFQDNENGELLEIDLSSQTESDHLNQNTSSLNQKLLHQMHSSKIDFLDLTTDQDTVEALIQFFMEREKKR